MAEAVPEVGIRFFVIDDLTKSFDTAFNKFNKKAESKLKSFSKKIETEITKGTKNFGSALNDTFGRPIDNAFKKVNKLIAVEKNLQKAHANNTKELFALNKALKSNANNTNLLKEKKAILAKTVKNLSQALKNNARVGDQTAKTFKRYSLALSNTDKRIKDLTKSTKTSSRATKSYATSIKSVIKSQLEWAVTGRLVFGVINKITEAFGGFFKFEDLMNKVKAVTKATNTELTAMRTLVRGLSKEFPSSASEIADAMLVIVRAVPDVNKAMALLPASLRLTTVTGGKLSDAIDTIITSMTAFKLGADDVTHIVEVLTVAFNDSRLETEELRTIFNFVAGTASSLGISIEAVAASVATFRQQGLKASTIGTAFSSLLIDLEKGSSRLQSTLGLTNAEMVKLRPSANNLADIFTFLQSKLGRTEEGLKKVTRAFGKEKATDAFTKRVARLVLGIQQLNTKELRELIESFKNATGATDQFSVVMESAVQQSKLLFNAFDNLIASVLRLFPGSGDSGFAGAIKVLNFFIDSITSTISFIGKLNEALGEIPSLLALVSFWLLIISKNVKGVTFSLSGLALIIKTHPLLALTSLIVGILLAFGNLDEAFADTFGDETQRDVKAVNDELDKTGKSLDNLKKKTTEPKGFISQFVSKFLEGIKQIKKELEEVFDIDPTKAPKKTKLKSPFSPSDLKRLFRTEEDFTIKLTPEQEKAGLELKALLKKRLLDEQEFQIEREVLEKKFAKKRIAIEKKVIDAILKFAKEKIDFDKENIEENDLRFRLAQKKLEIIKEDSNQALTELDEKFKRESVKRDEKQARKEKRAEDKRFKELMEKFEITFREQDELEDKRTGFFRGVTIALNKFRSQVMTTAETGATFFDTISEGMVGAFANGLDQMQGRGEAFEDWFVGFAKTLTSTANKILSQQIFNAIISQSVSQSPPGAVQGPVKPAGSFAQGGSIMNAKPGGRVPGTPRKPGKDTKENDTVLANLSPKEFVIKGSSVTEKTLPFLALINKLGDKAVGVGKALGGMIRKKPIENGDDLDLGTSILGSVAASLITNLIISQFSPKADVPQLSAADIGLENLFKSLSKSLDDIADKYRTTFELLNKEYDDDVTAFEDASGKRFLNEEDFQTLIAKRGEIVAGFQVTEEEVEAEIAKRKRGEGPDVTRGLTPGIVRAQLEAEGTPGQEFATLEQLIAENEAFFKKKEELSKLFNDREILLTKERLSAEEILQLDSLNFQINQFDKSVKARFVIEEKNAEQIKELNKEIREEGQKTVVELLEELGGIPASLLDDFIESNVLTGVSAFFNKDSLVGDIAKFKEDQLNELQDLFDKGKIKQEAFELSKSLVQEVAKKRTLELEEKFQDRVFDAQATELQKLQKAREKELDLVRGNQSAILSVNELFDIKEADLQKQATERFKEGLFDLEATEIEKLEREKDLAIEQAEEVGAETFEIEEFFAAKKIKLEEDFANDKLKIIEKLNEDIKSVELAFKGEKEVAAIEKADIIAQFEAATALEGEDKLTALTDLQADVTKFFDDVKDNPSFDLLNEQSFIVTLLKKIGEAINNVPAFKDGGVLKFFGGGSVAKINGPGSGTSDSVRGNIGDTPFNVSNGELLFILKKKAADLLLPVLESFNGDPGQFINNLAPVPVPSFQGGGVVGNAISKSVSTPARSEGMNFTFQTHLNFPNSTIVGEAGIRELTKKHIQPALAKDFENHTGPFIKKLDRSLGRRT